MGCGLGCLTSGRMIKERDRRVIPVFFTVSVLHSTSYTGFVLFCTNKGKFERTNTVHWLMSSFLNYHLSYLFWFCTVCSVLSYFQN